MISSLSFFSCLSIRRQQKNKIRDSCAKKIVTFTNRKKLVLSKKFFVIIMKFLILNVTKCCLSPTNFSNVLNVTKQTQFIFVYFRFLWIVIMPI